MTTVLRLRGGTARRLRVDHWCGEATSAERDLLLDLEAPVLDLGCGPGRLVVALGEEGIPALGVDASPHAAAEASARGANVLCRSVFDPLPGEGRWASALLLDGNVGIGGAPTALLARCRELLHPRGSVLVETDPPGSPTQVTEARLEADDHDATLWFPWACVAADSLGPYAAPAGLAVDGWLHPEGRWIARLRPVVRAVAA